MHLLAVARLFQRMNARPRHMQGSRSSEDHGNVFQRATINLSSVIMPRSPCVMKNTFDPPLTRPGHISDIFCRAFPLSWKPLRERRLSRARARRNFAASRRVPSRRHVFFHRTFPSRGYTCSGRIKNRPGMVGGYVFERVCSHGYAAPRKKTRRNHGAGGSRARCRPPMHFAVQSCATGREVEG